MKGSTSSTLYLVDCGKEQHPERYVLRVLDNAPWLAAEPDLAHHEAAALEFAWGAGLPAPRVVDYASDDVGFGAPALLMTYIPGEVVLRPPDPTAWLRALAKQLAAIHQHPADAFPWSYRSWLDRSSLAVPGWSRWPSVWAKAIERAIEHAPEAPHVFIHRDYHPTNVLWRGDSLAGVVDWINACRGPAGVDVAHCRSNLVIMFGPDMADTFLEVYREFALGFEYDPYWDLDSFLGFCTPRPNYYAPWAAFGLGPIDQATLETRVDAYLARLVALV